MEYIGEMACCVPRCGNKKPGRGLTYHCFPCDPYISSKWVRSINVSMPNGGSWRPDPNARVCSDHFLNTDFKPNTLKSVLKPDAVPSDFSNLSKQSADIGGGIPVKRKRIETPSSSKVVQMQAPDEDDDDEMDVSLMSILNSPQKKKLLASKNTSVNKPTKVIEKIVNTPITASKISKVNARVNTESLQLPKTSAADKSGVVQETAVPKTPIRKPSSPQQRNQNSSMNLIEIGPSTFLKINPEVIKVTEKITPSGNTVLQFLMNANSSAINPQNLFEVTSNASSPSAIVNTGTTMVKQSAATFKATTPLRKPQVKTVASASKAATPSPKPQVKNVDIVFKAATPLPKSQDIAVTGTSKAAAPLPNPQGMAVASTSKAATPLLQSQGAIISNNPDADNISSQQPKGTCSLTPKIVGVSSMNQEVSITSSNNVEPLSDTDSERNMIPDTTSANENISFMNSPASLTTNFRIRHPGLLSSDKEARYISTIKHKTKLLSNLRSKLAKLTKKTEELETKCMVQERQLDLSSMKKLKTIKKGSENGDAHATFILEQIRGYPNNVQVRWSASTMNQCSVWCRKAPYAYEYFKKAELFRLPSVNTVKRYLKTHPDVTTQIKNRTLFNVSGLDSDSSDFDFDDDNEEGFLEETEDFECYYEIPQSQNIIPSSNKQKISRKNNSATTSKIIPGSIPYERNSTETSEDGRREDVANTLAGIAHQTDDTVVVVATDSVLNSTTIPVTSSGQTITSKSGGTTLVITDNGKASEGEPGKTEGETVTTINLNGQDIVLQPGNVIQLSGAFGNEFENQYFIVDSTDGTTTVDPQYTGQPVSYIIQSSEEQVVYVAENNNDPQDLSVSKE